MTLGSEDHLRSILSPVRSKGRKTASIGHRWLLLFWSILAVSTRLHPSPSFVHSFSASQFQRVPHGQSPISSTSLMGIKGFRSWFESQFPEAILSFNRDSEAAHEEFDHVLVDVNQLLHVALRRSRSEGHALTLFMKELDACFALASPRKSIVLAMDGPPSAAKLATQRRRRYSTVVRTEWKEQQLCLAVERGSSILSKRQEARKRRRYATETKTLCITPGTEFMDKAHQAVLYWAWQRLSNLNNPISKARVYLSPSTVPGEGEVKLLDWILQRNIYPSQSIAILGGDSDLVLEGFVIPPSITHNVFVLLPDGNKRNLAINLWETTRALSRFLPKLKSDDMMRVRTDMVLLLIMNGNDYLPKLRGSAGFNNLFHNYLRILHQWLSDESHGDAQPFLVDPDTLEFNLPFSLAFFRHLAQLAPHNLLNATTLAKLTVGAPRVTPLGQLNKFVDCGFMPRPFEWEVISDDNIDHRNDDLLEEPADTEDDNDDSSGDDEEQWLVRLTLGEEGTEQFFEYEVWHDRVEPLKQAKQRLASMAIEDITGDIFIDMDEDVEDMEDDSFGSISNAGYAWEVKRAISGKVDTYLGGLLWNLQTYQDGICADYAYNYGRRMSPTAKEIVAFLKEAMEQKRIVGPRELLGCNFSPPVSAGLSCLAALPSQVHELIPEPYNWLIPDNTVEEIYAACMDPEDNVFDMKRFECLCEKRIQQMREEREFIKEKPLRREGRRGRRILLGDHYWTVISRTKVPLSHPFEPPAPFSERLSNLKTNRRLKASRAFATSKPRPRSVWSPEMIQREKEQGQKQSFGKDKHEIRHSDMGSLLKTVLGDVSIEGVGYKKAYQAVKDVKKTKRKKVKIDLSLKKVIIREKNGKSNGEKKKKNSRHRVAFDATARMKKFKIVPTPSDPARNIEGFTAMQCLKQLGDVEMIGSIEWDHTTPSKSAYAAVDPFGHESVQLVVRKGAKPQKSVLDEDLTYEQDRDIKLVSRKAVKQHLASFALCDLIGPQRRWSEMSSKDIKSYLTQQKVPATGDSAS